MCRKIKRVPIMQTKRTTQDVQQGDLDFLEKKKQTKLSSSYEEQPYHLLRPRGDQVYLKSAQGVEYKRKIQQVKRLTCLPMDPGKSLSSEQVENPVHNQPISQEVFPTPAEKTSTSSAEELIPHQATPMLSRSGRLTRSPKRLLDYVTTKCQMTLKRLQ